MTPEESVDRLREMLMAEALSEGGSLDSNAVEVAWDVFKAFARLPVDGMSREDDSDGLLFQTGVYDWHDGRGPRFSFSMVRQFSFDDEDGDYDHMEQLECVVLFDPVPGLAALPRAELWSFEMALDEWFAAVEALESFRGVVGSSLTPFLLEVHLDEV